MSMKILKCNETCSHPTAPSHAQDSFYGKGMRLHRVDEKGDVIKQGCTVCGISYRLETSTLAQYPWIPVEAGKKD